MQHNWDISWSGCQEPDSGTAGSLPAFLSTQDTPLDLVPSYPRTKPPFRKSSFAIEMEAGERFFPAPVERTLSSLQDQWEQSQKILGSKGTRNYFVSKCEWARIGISQAGSPSLRWLKLRLLWSVCLASNCFSSIQPPVCHAWNLLWILTILRM